MNLYNSYCYESLDLAAASFYSKGIIDNLGILSSYSINSTLNTASFIYLPLSQVGKNNPAYSSFSVRFLQCTQTGFDNSFFGVTAVDSVLISWAVVGVLVAAYKFKAIKKMMSL